MNSQVKPKGTLVALPELRAAALAFADRIAVVEDKQPGSQVMLCYRSLPRARKAAHAVAALHKLIYGKEPDRIPTRSGETVNTYSDVQFPWCLLSLMHDLVTSRSTATSVPVELKAIDIARKYLSVFGDEHLQRISSMGADPQATNRGFAHWQFAADRAAEALLEFVRVLLTDHQIEIFANLEILIDGVPPELSDRTRRLLLLAIRYWPRVPIEEFCERYATPPGDPDKQMYYYVRCLRLIMPKLYRTRTRAGFTELNGAKLVFGAAPDLIYNAIDTNPHTSPRK